MENSSNNILKIIGIILAVVLIWGAYRYVSSRRSGGARGNPTPTVTVTWNDRQREALPTGEESKFDIDLPQTGTKTSLRGIEGSAGNGVAVRENKNGVYEISILADLADPEAGKFYEVWLLDGDRKMSLGEMRIAKGGYLLEKTVSEDISSYTKYVITLEGTRDNEMEKRILEGNL
jgi:hypothetical protein